MDKASRREVIRQRLKAKGALLPFPKGGPRREPPGMIFGNGKVLDFYRLKLVESGPPAWVGVADPSKPVRLAPKRVARPSPLMLIAARYPKRSPRPSRD